MTAAVPALEPSEYEAEGLSEPEHREMAWHLREMKEQAEDIKRRLQMAFPGDDRHERWCNSILNAVGNIRAALAKDLRLSHKMNAAEAKRCYGDDAK